MSIIIYHTAILIKGVLLIEKMQKINVCIDTYVFGLCSSLWLLEFEVILLSYGAGKNHCP